MCSPGHTVATEDGLLAPTWSWAGPTLGLVQGVPRDPPCAAGGGGLNFMPTRSRLWQETGSRVHQ